MILLTNTCDSVVLINPSYIISAERYTNHKSEWTELRMTTGHIDVKETPEEIYEQTKNTETEER